MDIRLLYYKFRNIAVVLYLYSIIWNGLKRMKSVQYNIYCILYKFDINIIVLRCRLYIWFRDRIMTTQQWCDDMNVWNVVVGRGADPCEFSMENGVEAVDERAWLLIFYGNARKVQPADVKCELVFTIRTSLVNFLYGVLPVPNGVKMNILFILPLLLPLSYCEFALNSK